MDEIILIDKPKDMSSFGVVARVRRILTERNGAKVKVGHTGTLDPFATGLLILLAGKATKRSNDFLKLDKVYEATMVLGKTSTTGDTEGEISNFDGNVPTEDEVEFALEAFVGESEQKVPAFSAVKINGGRAYDLARKGQEVETPTRTIAIYNIELLEYKYPEIKYRAHVSSGTYIRTLSEDIGKALGTRAYTSELRRLKIGDYKIEDATTLEDFMN
ncbi:MAG: tRNA pseudouridine(55) synthase TruB [Candidatus Saccharibacteria bacterium]|nr:tRNA pseudouridine(55) synthase TruB [Candidatus Saccharibacteria bacterium]